MWNSAGTRNNVKTQTSCCSSDRVHFSVFRFTKIHLKPNAKTVRLQGRVWTVTALGHSHSSCITTPGAKCVVGSFKICITWHAPVTLFNISINTAFEIQRMTQMKIFGVRRHLKKDRVKWFQGTRKWRWYPTNTENDKMLWSVSFRILHWFSYLMCTHTLKN